MIRVSQKKVKDWEIHKENQGMYKKRKEYLATRIGWIKNVKIIRESDEGSHKMEKRYIWRKKGGERIK